MRSREDSIDYLEKSFSIDDFLSPIKNYFKPWQIENEIELRQQEKNIKNVVRYFLDSDRIFTVAMGRSKLAALNTGIRLMHVGYALYEVGHTYQPAIGNDGRYHDLLYAVSGSGKTAFVLSVASKTKDKNVPIIAITSNINSPLAMMATEKIVTKGKEIIPNGQPVPSEYDQPINFMQTKSEKNAFEVGEMIVNAVAKAKGVTEDEMIKLHSNVE